MSLPPWLKVPIYDSAFKTESILYDVNTICVHAKCPNRAECFSRKTATFLILGTICTRNCRYCNIVSGKPGPVDEKEPAKIASVVKKLGLRYVVITSVTRDDLADGGSSHFIKVMESLLEIDKTIKIELLIPDLTKENLDRIIQMAPYVLNHNIESTRKVFSKIRPKADYKRSLDILRYSKSKGLTTKTGFMIGLGEDLNDIKKTISDVSHVDILTIGQYIKPNKNCIEVKRFYTPEEFKKIKGIAQIAGIKKVYCAPFVRSSYHADTIN